MFCNLKKTIFLVVFVSFPVLFYAQERYVSAIFDSVEVQTFTYATKNGQNLELDYYSPYADKEERRPLIIYVHGGGFSSGVRNSPEIVKFCRQLAGCGYSTASISYRLTRKDKLTGFGCDCPVIDKLNTFQSALEDLQDAAFFLVQRRESLNFDPLKMILAGSSAGAETVLNAAFNPPMCYNLASGPVRFAGVISMAGAIADTMKIYAESAIPSLLFHGTCDDLVPYATAAHRYCTKGQPGFLTMYGSFTIARKLNELQVPYWLHTTCGGGHEIASTPMNSYFKEIVQFCNDYVIKKTGTAKRTIIPGNQSGCQHEHFGFCNP